MTRATKPRTPAGRPGFDANLAGTVPVRVALLMVLSSPAWSGENPAAPEMPPQVPLPSETELALISCPAVRGPACRFAAAAKPGLMPSPGNAPVTGQKLSFQSRRSATNN